MFNKKSPQKASELLAASSSEAISIFTATVTRLQTLAKDASDAAAQNQKQIDALNEENAKLSAIKEQNENLATKILGLLNV